MGSNPGSEIIPFIKQLSEENRQLGVIDTITNEWGETEMAAYCLCHKYKNGQLLISANFLQLAYLA